MTSLPLETIEKRRLRVQDILDDKKSQLERNKLGQFATPAPLAIDIISFVSKVFPRHEKVRFLDPAFGTGAFYYACLQEFGASVEAATGFEIDSGIAEAAEKLWGQTQLNLIVEDFTRAIPTKDLANLVVCNPPYVRHHHLPSTYKEYLRGAVERDTDIGLSGLSGFYCYYVLLTHKWMDKGALAAWLIPGEFMDVNYGAGLREYLTQKVSLLRIHRFDPRDVQFTDADVSSVVVFFKNEAPKSQDKVEMTYGGSLSNPKTSNQVSLEQLRGSPKWTSCFGDNHSDNQARARLEDVFLVKRGLATGSNEFFILNEEETEREALPREFLKPILPMPRHLNHDVITADSEGNPTIRPRLFLISCSLNEKDLRSKYPSLWRYFQKGVKKGINQRYLCKHRSPWYSQEERSPVPFLCTYMGRASNHRPTPFRFILNRSKAIASNSYLLLYPKPQLARLLEKQPELYDKIWNALKSVTSQTLTDAGRVYGGGLHKLEPSELANLPISGIME